MTDSREVAPLTAVAPTVLVVDDEKNIRRTLEMVLGGEGYRVLEADSAEQALEHPDALGGVGGEALEQVFHGRSVHLFVEEIHDRSQGWPLP